MQERLADGQSLRSLFIPKRSQQAKTLVVLLTPQPVPGKRPLFTPYHREKVSSTNNETGEKKTNKTPRLPILAPTWASMKNVLLGFKDPSVYFLCDTSEVHKYSDGFFSGGEGVKIVANLVVQAQPYDYHHIKSTSIPRYETRSAHASAKPIHTQQQQRGLFEQTSPHQRENLQ